MSGEGLPTVDQIAEAIRAEGRKCGPLNAMDMRFARVVVELYRPHLEQAPHASDAIRALREIATVSIPELNPDGVDQAAHTMRLIATSYLDLMGVDLPEQRTSMDDGEACICGRATGFRDALEEITSPPDASKGEYYGCADLHEARMTAREALDDAPVREEQA